MRELYPCSNINNQQPSYLGIAINFYIEGFTRKAAGLGNTEILIIFLVIFDNMDEYFKNSLIRASLHPLKSFIDNIMKTRDNQDTSQNISGRRLLMLNNGDVDDLIFEGEEPSVSEK
jgi:hypothetical protein